MSNLVKLLAVVCVCYLQTAESVAESVMNLASAEACVRVTVDRVVESAATTSGTGEDEVASSSQSNQQSSSSPNAPLLPPLKDLLAAAAASTSHQTSADCSNLANLANLANEQRKMTTTSTSQSVAQAAAARAAQNAAQNAAALAVRAQQAPSSAEQQKAGAGASAGAGAGAGASAAAAGDDKEAERSGSLMSVSVPNLSSSSVEQTVSLLESFAVVARRNLGNSSNNMSRTCNTNSLVRLAMQPNSPGN